MVNSSIRRCVMATCFFLGMGISCLALAPRPESWRNLATFDRANDGVTVISSRGIVKPVFQLVGEETPVPLEHLGSVTLIRYERRTAAEGTTVQRWEGDVAGQFQYVEIERRELNVADFTDGTLSLEPGWYRFKHLSVSGQPPTGYYGESGVFGIEPTEEIFEVVVSLFPAI